MLVVFAGTLIFSGREILYVYVDEILENLWSIFMAYQ
jgi:hypothetical protein